MTLEFVIGERTAAELASQYEIHATQISKWKKYMLENLPELFSNNHEKDQEGAEQLQAELYRQTIDRLAQG